MSNDEEHSHQSATLGHGQIQKSDFLAEFYMAKCKKWNFWQSFAMESRLTPRESRVHRGKPGCAMKEKDRITEVMRSLKFQMIA